MGHASTSRRTRTRKRSTSRTAATLSSRWRGARRSSCTCTCARATVARRSVRDDASFVQLMGNIRRGEARDKDYRLNQGRREAHADDAEPTVRARRLFVFDSVCHRLTNYAQEIWPTNAKVNAVNRQGLERLKDPPKRFEHVTWVRPFKNIRRYIGRRGDARAQGVRLHQVRAASSNAHVACRRGHDQRRYNKLVEPTVDLKPGARIYC